jgi:hypothetical protein
LKQFILSRINIYAKRNLFKTSREELFKLIQEKCDYLRPDIEKRLKARAEIEKKNMRTHSDPNGGHVTSRELMRNDDRNTPKKPFLLHLNEDDKSAMDETASYYGLSASELLRVLIRVTNLQLPLRNYRFLTRDNLGRAINLELVKEMENTPLEFRKAVAAEYFQMDHTVSLASETLSALNYPTNPALTNTDPATPAIPPRYFEELPPWEDSDEDIPKDEVDFL